MRDEAYNELDIQSGSAVVGVGTSAGGLDAFCTLPSGLRPEHGLAIVFVQHLDPDHDSLLHELLSKKVVALDGATAVRAIKKAGGLVFVQVPKQAVHGGMPKSALPVQASVLGILNANDYVRVLTVNKAETWKLFFNPDVFNITEDGYEISVKLREVVRSSSQRIIQDPPHSRDDLASCRNVANYFEPVLQGLASQSGRLRLYRPSKGLAQQLNFPATSAPLYYAGTEPENAMRQSPRAPYARIPINKVAPQFVVPGIRSHDESYAQGLEAELEKVRETTRATVEKLETSNQELSTTNKELRSKVAELREANDDLANLMRSTNVITLFVDDDLRLRFFTPASQCVFRIVEADRGRQIDDIGGDVDMGYLRARCREVLTSGVPIEEEIETNKRDRRYTLKILCYSGDGASKSRGIVCTMTDVTELRQVVFAAQTERRVSQRSLAEIEQLYFVSPQAMALMTPDTTYLRVNRQMAEVNGRDAAAHFGEKMREIVPDLGEQIDAAFEIVLNEGKPIVGLQMEGETAAHVGDRRLFSTDWYPVRIDNQIVAVGVNFRDITEQTEMQAELRRIMQELQHRVKNMLSNVLALVSRARREADANVCVLDTLAARIRALSQTHKLLTKENWRAADIYALIEPELTHVYGVERVSLAGPRIELNARAAVALGMAIHELATNAVKYGAFSQGGGRVSLSWMRIDDGTEDRLVFRWIENGGPPVSSGSGAGFGSQLIASTITGSLHGAVETDWRPEGLVVEMTVPFETLGKTKEEVVYDVF